MIVGKKNIGTKENPVWVADIPEGVKVISYKYLRESDNYYVEAESESITRKQFMIGIKLWKWNGSALEPQIQAVIDSLPQKERLVAQTSFSEAGSFSRTDAMLVQLAKALGMQDSDIDEFFTYCASEAWL